jgi:hypothetical protein
MEIVSIPVIKLHSDSDMAHDNVVGSLKISEYTARQLAAVGAETRDPALLYMTIEWSDGAFELKAVQIGFSPQSGG